ncbi:MAG: SecY-interacting protein [Gammaproteobacteria bacterium]|nr:SecY-interacting protein [Gammaproteobacteria bacterium]
MVQRDQNSPEPRTEQHWKRASLRYNRTAVQIESQHRTPQTSSLNNQPGFTAVCTMQESATVKALRAFIDRAKIYLQKVADGRFTLPFDEEWRSPCEQEQSRGNTYWFPVEQRPNVSFERLSEALEVTLHPDICDYYQTFWSGSLGARDEQRDISLLQLWNHDDHERLMSNLIGHALEKRRLKHDFTIFFGTAEPDGERILSVHNRTGEVLLEYPGVEPFEVLASGLSEYLDTLTPVNTSPDIY